MRIERLEVGGFGRFANVAWDLEPGLTVMLGENEAGKTTLLNALRAILFGFEPSRDGRAWYPALAGGRRGGRLTVVTAAGERWIVERFGQRGGAGALSVQAPNGNQGGQETLDRLLHGADRDLFNTIFAFGLGELQDFDSLGGDGVRGRIYGAAAGLGGTSAVDLERRLRQEQDELFRPTGRLQPINALFARIDELNRRIAELTRQPDAFEAAHRERAEAQSAAQAKREAASELRARVARLRRLLDAAPVVATLHELEAELASTDPRLDAFPPDAVAVLDRRVAAHGEERARLEAIDDQLAEIEVAAAGLSVEAPLVRAADELWALDAERRSAAGAEDRLRAASAAAARHEAVVTEQLARVGSWDEPRLLDVDDSIAAVEATREHERELASARDALGAAEGRARAAADELAARERDTGPSTDAAADEAWAAVRELERLRARRATGLRPLAGLPRGVPARAVLFGAVVLVGSVLGAVLGNPLVGGVLGAVLASAVIVALRPASLDHGREAALLAQAGLSEDATDDDIARRLDVLAEARVRRSIARDSAALLEERRREAAELAESVDAARQVAGHVEARWEAWLEQRGFPPTSSPEVVRQIMAAAGVARRAAVERDEQRRIVAAIEARREELDRRAESLLAALEVAGAGTVDGRLSGVLARLERSLADQRTAQELDARRRALVERHGPLASSVDALARSVADHLASLGSVDADELRGRAERAAERRALLSRIREARAELAGIAGGPDAIDALRTELRGRDLADVQGELASALEEVEAIERAERELVARVGELDALIRSLEAADELGTLRQELASVEGRAFALARAWAVRAIASRLLSETRSRYERERQPDVVRAASTHFERITGGRYARIVAPPGDASVRVEMEGGEGRLTHELSRGTAEQLYLALRFGLIEEFAEHAEPLPVVMDDILVNFDADRATRAAAAIRGLAERHQVLYFTCHAWTAGMLDPGGDRTLALG